jgi:hypothetical protein
MDLDVDLSIDESALRHPLDGGTRGSGSASESDLDASGEAAGTSGASAPSSGEGTSTTVTIHRDFARLIDQARESTGESRAEYINRLALEDFAPNPRAKANGPIESLVKIAVALAPFGWGFGVRTLPPRDSGDTPIHLAELKSDLFTFESLHRPRDLFRFAHELRQLANFGGSAVLSSLGSGKHGKAAVYIAKRNRRTIVIEVTMTIGGERYSESSVTVSSRDIEKTARFFEYIAVITHKAPREYPEGF